MTKEGAFKGSIGLSLLAGFAWICLFLYWHFKILGAISSMINEAAPPKPGSVNTKIGYSVPDEPLEEVRDAGCRAFSYLVNSLDPEKNPAYLLVVEEVLRKATEPPTPGTPGLHPQCPEVQFALFDEPADRKRKVEEIRAWWTAHGQEFHQGWRIWSSHCAKD